MGYVSFREGNWDDPPSRGRTLNIQVTRTCHHFHQDLLRAHQGSPVMNQGPKAGGHRDQGIPPETNRHSSIAPETLGLEDEFFLFGRRSSGWYEPLIFRGVRYQCTLYFSSLERVVFFR